jgi:putative ubiquitin-RnfH superfamily antitoxin RatB of RatAB toxin-antitoxin module
MAQIIKFKRSTTAGAIPETGSLQYGEIAMNVTDGKVFFRKSGSVDSIESVVTTNTSTAIAGNLNISGSITASYFVGDGSRLENITVAQAATIQRSFTNSSTWVVNHNLDTPNAIAQVYDADGYQIIPSTLRQTNTNTITVTFESARSGYVVVAKGGHIVSGSINANNIDGLTNSITNQVNALGIFSGSSQITLSGDVTGTANASVISSIDGGSI